MSSRVTLAAIAIFLGALPLPEVGAAPDAAEERVSRQIERLLRGPLRDGTTSLYVADATTGERVFAAHADDALNPASNVKLIATAAALDILGPDYRYVTRLLGELPDETGELSSDLYLLGTWDPTLTADGIAGLARELAARGVTRLSGDVVVGEAPSRDGIFRSAVELSLRAGEPGAPPTATVTPTSDFVDVVVEATTAKTRRVRRGITTRTEWYVDDAGHRRLRIVVAGAIGRGRSLDRTVWIRERALHTAHLLRGALRDAGVAVTGDVHVTELRDYLDASLARGFIPLPLAEHRSPPLSQIIRRINKRSTNWLADRIIMTAAARRYGGAPAMDKAVDAMYAWLARRVGLGRDDLVIDTGSGLSYGTAMSARQVVDVLRAGLGLGRADEDEARTARLAPLRAAYRESLAIGGKDGTIRHRFERLDGTVLGKTGTLNQIVALSGLLEVSPDRRLVFSIITNGHRPSRRARVRRAHEQLVGALCDYLHHVR